MKFYFLELNGSSISLAECLDKLHHMGIHHWTPVRLSLDDSASVLKLKALISSMLQYQPDERPTAQQVLGILTEVSCGKFRPTAQQVLEISTEVSCGKLRYTA